MNFVFDTIRHGEFRNFTKCPDKNQSGIRRFTPSPIVTEFVVNQATRRQSNHTFETIRPKGQTYVIATGVAHAPWDWCGPDSTGLGYNKNTPNRASLFAHIGKKHLTSLQRGRAYLLIDQSHEGYQTEWLWQWFHNNCETYNISPRQIIYVTGNLDSKDQYSEWAKDRLKNNRMLVVPYPHFESSIANILNNNLERYPSFEQHVQYKESNKNNIKTYSALQKRPRAHRAWFFKHLHDANLIGHGINSMNTFTRNNTYYEDKVMTDSEYESIIQQLPLLPPNNTGLERFADHDCGQYLTMFNEQIMLDTWVTIISEASFGDSEHECFLSEKTFKPIACYHPFIIVGNKNSLYRLKELGYKTFSPFIDESYDTLNTWPRMEAITKEITRINRMSLTDKVEWFHNLKPILDYNYKLLKSRSSRSPSLYLNTITEYIDIGKTNV